MQIPNDLPTDLKDVAISLKDIGVAGSAWRLANITAMIEWLENATQSIILGGDLYLYIKNKDVYPMRENWYYEPKHTQADHRDSIEKARNFLESYKTHPMHVDIIVDLVVQ